jgi:hypothetical protein
MVRRSILALAVAMGLFAAVAVPASSAPGAAPGVAARSATSDRGVLDPGSCPDYCWWVDRS